jgi:hypothetical protein
MWWQGRTVVPMTFHAATFPEMQDSKQASRQTDRQAVQSGKAWPWHVQIQTADKHKLYEFCKFQKIRRDTPIKLSYFKGCIFNMN